MHYFDNWLRRYASVSFLLCYIRSWASLNVVLMTARVRLSKKNAPINTRGKKNRNA